MSATPNSKHITILYFIITTVILLLSTWLLSSYNLNTAIRSTTQPPTEAEEYSYVPPLSEQYYNILLLGVDQLGMADVIVLVSVNFFSDLIVITSISRDTYVEDQNWVETGTGQNHLTFASYVRIAQPTGKDYKAGAANTAYWVEELFGVVINDYALITHEGFIEMIDSIGGVEVDVNPLFEGKRIDVFDKYIDPLPTGLQRLSGSQAFAFSRYRGITEDKRIPETGSVHDDGDRMIRNQQLLKAINKQLKGLRTAEVLRIIKKAPDFVHTSVNLWDLATTAPKLHRAQFDEIITIVIPGEFVEVYEDKIGANVYYFLVDFEMADAILSGLGLKWEDNQ